MANDSYNPIADTVSVTYKCPECEEITTSEAYNVPLPDFSADKARDSERSEDYYAICEHCGASTPVYLYSRLDGGYIDMPEVEEIVNIEESFPEDDLITDNLTED